MSRHNDSYTSLVKATDHEAVNKSPDGVCILSSGKEIGEKNDEDDGEKRGTRRSKDQTNVTVSSARDDLSQSNEKPVSLDANEYIETIHRCNSLTGVANKNNAITEPVPPAFYVGKKPDDDASSEAESNLSMASSGGEHPPESEYSDQDDQIHTSDEISLCDDINRQGKPWSGQHDFTEIRRVMQTGRQYVTQKKSTKEQPKNKQLKNGGNTDDGQICPSRTQRGKQVVFYYPHYDKDPQSPSAKSLVRPNKLHDSNVKGKRVPKQRACSNIRRIQEKLQEDLSQSTTSNQSHPVPEKVKSTPMSSLPNEINGLGLRRQRSRSRASKYSVVQRPYRRWLGVSTNIFSDARYIVNAKKKINAHALTSLRIDPPFVKPKQDEHEAISLSAYDNEGISLSGDEKQEEEKQATQADDCPAGEIQLELDKEEDYLLVLSDEHQSTVSSPCVDPCSEEEEQRVEEGKIERLSQSGRDECQYVEENQKEDNIPSVHTAQSSSEEGIQHEEEGKCQILHSPLLYSPDKKMQIHKEDIASSDEKSPNTHDVVQEVWEDNENMGDTQPRDPSHLRSPSQDAQRINISPIQPDETHIPKLRKKSSRKRAHKKHGRPNTDVQECQDLMNGDEPWPYHRMKKRKRAEDSFQEDGGLAGNIESVPCYEFMDPPPKLDQESRGRQKMRGVQFDGTNGVNPLREELKRYYELGLHPTRIKQEQSMSAIGRLLKRHKTNGDKKLEYYCVQATESFRGKLPGQLAFEKGQIIKQLDTGLLPKNGMSYGYYRSGRLRRKKYGLYPCSYVTCQVQESD